jgi:hypothetical protein
MLGGISKIKFLDYIGANQAAGQSLAVAMTVIEIRPQQRGGKVFAVARGR